MYNSVSTEQENQFYLNLENIGCVISLKRYYMGKYKIASWGCFKSVISLITNEDIYLLDVC